MSVRNQRPTYGGTAMPYTPLLPWQVRERRFKPVGLGRRGLEPDHVYAFLDRVAVDMAAVYAALAASRREAAVLRAGLHRIRADRSPEA
ncbi:MULTISPECIES: DivIVA domain-containing protein [unclassified Micromonospora]|uniref:DivIVA domain-containing protein n=1 Tax=unclassified Micromonospora TaxID=2617518 RepID=UPI002FF36C35